MGKGPLARSADLIVDSIGDELLVYDTLSNRAHSLNSVSAVVWQACDGTRSARDIAARTAVDLPAVELALDNLADIELIDGHQRTGISRRAALRRITVGAAGLAVALPVIRSITAPTAAMALSTCNANGDACTGQTCCAGSFCSGDGQCLSGTGKSSRALCYHASSCEYPLVCSSQRGGGGSGHLSCQPKIQ
jgi:hypothetical protein